MKIAAARLNKFYPNLNNNKMHQEPTIQSGLPVEQARAALILVHGRGGSAQDILSLADHLETDEFALLAPQARNHSWYPYSFLAPRASNQPWLDSALSLLKTTTDELRSRGLSSDQIFLVGFSQGACLALEFAASQATRYGGIIAFTGGLIGETLEPENYSGDFAGTPVFIGTSDPDPHVPLQRVLDTEAQYRKMNASIEVKIYPGMGHTIVADEIARANQMLQTV